MTASSIVIVALSLRRIFSIAPRREPADWRSFIAVVSHRPEGKLVKTVFFVTIRKSGTFLHKVWQFRELSQDRKRLFTLDPADLANLASQNSQNK